jgi:hypothetical protein
MSIKYKYVAMPPHVHKGAPSLAILNLMHRLPEQLTLDGDSALFRRLFIWAITFLLLVLIVPYFLG